MTTHLRAADIPAESQCNALGTTAICESSSVLFGDRNTMAKAFSNRSFALAASVCAVAWLVAPGQASAQIVGFTGFEAPPFTNPDPGYFYTYAGDYAGYGDSTPGGGNVDGGDFVVTSGSLSGDGVGDSGAFVVSVDSTALPQAGSPSPRDASQTVYYSYFGTFQGFGMPATAPLTSGNLADFEFSIDLRVEGLLQGQTEAAFIFAIELQAPDNTLGEDEGDGNDTVLRLEFDSPATQFVVGSNFATFTRNLNDYSKIAGGSLANFATYSSSVSVFATNFNVNDGTARFGYDADNRFLFDNVTFTQIPEPGSVLLFGTGAMIAMARRRRSKR